VDGAARRIRPKVMTVAAMIAGLAPILWSMGDGADVMKRIACPMIPIYPVVYDLWKSRAVTPERGRTPELRPIALLTGSFVSYSPPRLEAHCGLFGWI
jgi:Cu(I)/Ag(I) efflux system membrane protein CusA/SilA